MKPIFGDTEIVPLAPEMGRVVWPDALRYTAQRMRLTADVLEQLRIRDRAGKIVIAAFNSGLLCNLPGLEELVTFHTSPEPKDGPPLGKFQFVRTPANLFMELAGGHLLPVFNGPNGIEVVGPVYGGLIPKLGFPTDTVSEQPQRFVDACETIAKLIEAWKPPIGPPAEKQPDVPNKFPTPPGAQWSDVHIKFFDGENVSIQIRDVRRRISFEQMGMMDKRSQRTNKQWQLLVSFARGNGVLTWESSDAGARNQKRREVLGKALQQYFQISGDPIVWEDNSWKTKFHISGE